MAEQFKHRGEREMANANCNWWQYSRFVWNISRTEKFWKFTDDERTAVLAFINDEMEAREWLVDGILNKFGVVKPLEEQPDYVLAKILGKIGRNLKVVPPTEAEKEACDALFDATGDRKEKLPNIKDESESVTEASESTIDESESVSKSESIVEPPAAEESESKSE